MTEPITRARDKYIGTSKLYRCVYIYQQYTNGRLGALMYRAQIRRNKVYHSSMHATERQAAMKVDLVLIEHKIEPVNILKRKNGNNYPDIHPGTNKP